MSDVTAKGLAVIRSFEGRALKAYRDSVGVWTIGYGITNFDKWAVAYLGKPIAAGLTITEEQAEYLLVESLKRGYAPAVAAKMPGAKDNEFDGGMSFHYNTGAIGRASWVSKWLAKIDFHAALVSWNKAGGKELRGLTRRREREWAIIAKGDYGPEGNTPPPVLNANGKVVGVAESTHALAGTPGMLRYGDQGPEVADLNDKLAARGFAVNIGDTFDAMTVKAVTDFQTAHPQLQADGIAGPATRATLNREADVMSQLKTATTATTGTTAVSGVASHLLGAHLPIAVYVAIGVAGLIALAWVSWNYRDELVALAKRS